MKIRHFFSAGILILLAIVTSSMIIPEHIVPAPKMPLQTLLLKRTFAFNEIDVLNPSNNKKWTAFEKLVFRKLKKQSRSDLKSMNLLDKCDTIVMKDGSRFKGIVTETNQSEIFYKLCDDTEGPTYSIKKSQLSYIQYANGSRVFFKTVTDSEQSSKNRSFNSQTTDPLAIASLVTGGASLVLFLLGTITGLFGTLGFFGFIAAFILGLMSLKNIKKSKGKLKGKGMAIAGLLIGIGGILLLALLILLIVLLVVTIP